MNSNSFFLRLKKFNFLPSLCRIPTNIVSKPSPAASRSKVITCSNRPKLCAAPLLGRKMVQSTPGSGTGNHAQKSTSHQGKFILNMSGESESCSSAMSSLESVRSSEVFIIFIIKQKTLRNLQSSRMRRLNVFFARNSLTGSVFEVWYKTHP